MLYMYAFLSTADRGRWRYRLLMVAAAALWLVSVALLGADFRMGAGGAELGRFGLLTGEVAAAASLVAAVCMATRFLRVEHDITKVATQLTRDEIARVRSDGDELREMLARLDSHVDRVDSVDHYANGNRVRFPSQHPRHN